MSKEGRKKEGRRFRCWRFGGKERNRASSRLFPPSSTPPTLVFPQLWYALRVPLLILVHTTSMNSASPTSPPRLERLNSATPPPRASTSSSRGRSTPSAASYRVLIPTLHPRDEDLPLELRNYEIIDEVELKGFKVFAVGPW